MQLQGADSSQGFVVPYVTIARRPTPSDTTKGMVIYNLNDSALQYCDGVQWVTLTSEGLNDNDWVLDGDTLYSAPDSTITIVNGNVGINSLQPSANLQVMNATGNGGSLQIGLVNGGASYNFRIRGYNFYADVVGSSGLLALSEVNNNYRILNLPNYDARGVILYPTSATETTSAGLAFSTGRNIKASTIRMNNNTLFGSSANQFAGVDVQSNISFDAINNQIGAEYSGVWIKNDFSPNASFKKALYRGVYITPTINQTNGSDTVSRGIHVNPTLTSAPDFRALEISNSSGYGVYQDNSGATNYFAGNIGVGTSSPNQSLSVLGNIDVVAADSNTNSLVRIGRTSSVSNPAIWFINDWVEVASANNYNNKGKFRATEVVAGGATMGSSYLVNAFGYNKENIKFSDRWVIGNISTTKLKFMYWNPGDETDNILTLTKEGKIGIGTNSPDTTLHVEGSLKIVDGNQSNGYVLQSDANGVGTWVDPSTIVAADDGDWVLDSDTLYSAPDSTVVIKGGNVGIGALDPLYKIDVNGISGFRENIYLNNDGGVAPIWIHGSQSYSSQVAGRGRVGFRNTGLVLGDTGEDWYVNAGALMSGDNNSTRVIYNNAPFIIVSSNKRMIHFDKNTANPFFWIDASNSLVDQSENELEFHGITKLMEGNVGVGTSTPSAKLHIHNDASGSDSAFVVTSAGNVGIGTTSPDTTLHIEGSLKMVDGNQSNGYVLQSDANGIGTWVDPTTIATADDNDWTLDGDTLYSAPDSTVVIKGGNVGIGTTSPEKKLYISGGDIALDNNKSIFFENSSGTLIDILTYNSSNQIKLSSFLTLTSASSPYINLAVPNTPSTGFDMFTVTHTNTGSSGMSRLMSLNPTINQSGTAGYTVLKINPTETATGSGTKRLLDAQVGGVSKFVIQSDGNTGIGTATPASKLHISGNLQLGETGNGNKEFRTYDNAGNNYLRLATDVSNSFYFDLQGTSDTGSLDINQLNLTVSDGNVGIGTTTLDARLDIVSAGDSADTKAIEVKNSASDKLYELNDGGQEINYAYVGESTPQSGGNLPGTIKPIRKKYDLFVANASGGYQYAHLIFKDDGGLYNFARVTVMQQSSGAYIGEFLVAFSTGTVGGAHWNIETTGSDFTATKYNHTDGRPVIRIEKVPSSFEGNISIQVEYFYSHAYSRFQHAEELIMSNSANL